MKIRFLASNLFFAFVICSSLVADFTPETHKEIKCEIRKMNRKIKHRTHPHIPPKVSGAPTASGMTTSTNWSGYVALNNVNAPTNDTVSGVFGSWVVPSIAPSANSTSCAIWVGIDGYNSTSVEQIGTSHDWTSGAIQSYAWFEMYPQASFAINGFPLNVGDSISASVVYSAPNTFTMKLFNNTQRVVSTIPTTYTQSSTAQRNSAEWIVEAPYSGGILPLANFGKVQLQGCAATINDVTKTIGLLPNIGMNMINTSGGLKATTSAVGGPKEGAFSVTWDGQ